MCLSCKCFLLVFSATRGCAYVFVMIPTHNVHMSSSQSLYPYTMYICRLLSHDTHTQCTYVVFSAMIPTHNVHMSSTQSWYPYIQALYMCMHTCMYMCMYICMYTVSSQFLLFWFSPTKGFAYTYIHDTHTGWVCVDLANFSSCFRLINMPNSYIGTHIQDEYALILRVFLLVLAYSICQTRIQELIFSLACSRLPRMSNPPRTTTQPSTSAYKHTYTQYICVGIWESHFPSNVCTS